MSLASKAAALAIALALAYALHPAFGGGLASAAVAGQVVEAAVDAFTVEFKVVNATVRLPFPADPQLTEGLSKAAFAVAAAAHGFRLAGGAGALIALGGFAAYEALDAFLGVEAALGGLLDTVSTLTFQWLAKTLGLLHLVAFAMAVVGAVQLASLAAGLIILSMVFVGMYLGIAFTSGVVGRAAGAFVNFLNAVVPSPPARAVGVFAVAFAAHVVYLALAALAAVVTMGLLAAVATALLTVPLRAVEALVLLLTVAFVMLAMFNIFIVFMPLRDYARRLLRNAPGLPTAISGALPWMLVFGLIGFAATAGALAAVLAYGTVAYAVLSTASYAASGRGGFRAFSALTTLLIVKSLGDFVDFLTSTSFDIFNALAKSLAALLPG